MSGGHWNYRNCGEDWDDTVRDVALDIVNHYPKLSVRLLEIAGEIDAVKERYRLAYQDVTNDIDRQICGDDASPGHPENAGFEEAALARLK